MHPYPETYTILDGKDYAAHAAFIKEIWVELKKKIKLTSRRKSQERKSHRREEKRPRRARSRTLKGEGNQKM